MTILINYVVLCGEGRKAKKNVVLVLPIHITIVVAPGIMAKYVQHGCANTQ